MKKKFIQKNKGFTLIEMLVSVGLFTVVMTMSLAIIMSVIDGNKKSQSINSVSNNLGFAVESMVRDIKTGYNYRCQDVQFGSPDSLKSTVSDCNPGTGSYVIDLVSTITGHERGVQYKFVPPTANTVGYIEKRVCDPLNNSSTCNDAIKVTAPEINITDMEFYVSTPQSQGSVSAGQPGVFLIIRGTSQADSSTVSSFNLQTFISQRLLNI